LMGCLSGASWRGESIICFQGLQRGKLQDTPVRLLLAWSFIFDEAWSRAGFFCPIFGWFARWANSAVKRFALYGVLGCKKALSPLGMATCFFRLLHSFFSWEEIYISIHLSWRGNSREKLHMMMRSYRAFMAAHETQARLTLVSKLVS
jgi:hypothetical protein